MQCPSCHAEVSTGHRFCPRCGSPVSRDVLPTMTGPSPAAPVGSGPPSSGAGRFPVGSVIAGRYRILRALGRGGMGEVYHAHDDKLGQDVALKFLPEAAQSPDEIGRFQAEVRLARRVSHPNVCRVYDMGEADGTPFISMEYVDGEDLRSLLRRIGRLPPDKAIETARHLCAAVAAAHAVGVLHRDLKPANIMIDGQGQVHVMDFGVAALAEEIERRDVRSGTPAYMAPEQKEGREVTVRSDIYALGLVLFEMFTGRQALADRRDGTTPRSVPNLVTDVDPAVGAVIERCLERDPALRPASALQVARALPGGDPLAEALAAGETPSPDVVAASEQAGTLSVRAASACLFGIAIALVGLIVIGGRMQLVSLIPAPRPPQVLAEDARQMAAALGYAGPPADSAYRFVSADAGAMRAWARRAGADYRAMLAAGGLRPLLFFYRESPRALVPANPATVVQSVDPPRDFGDVVIYLAPDGRLFRLLAIPQERDMPAESRDWQQALFDAAGIDAATCTPGAPLGTLIRPFDENRGWTCKYPEGPSVRVYAAAWKGRPVYFNVVGPWNGAASGPSALGRRAATWVLMPLTVGVLLVGFLLAVRNYRRGRVDFRGGFRLAGFAFAVLMIRWPLAAHHGPIDAEFASLQNALSFALYVGARLLLFYVALEPLVRRWWPRSLISWTRLLGGHLRDAVVGGHVLVGVTAGVVAATILRVPYVVGGEEFLTTPSTGLAGLVGDSLQLLSASVDFTLFFVVIYFVSRLVLRRDWLAGLVVLVLYLVPLALRGQPMPSVVAYALVATIGLTILTRFGILPAAMTVLATNLAGAFLITPDLSAWYGQETIFLLVVILGLAAWSFHSALGGRRILREDFLEA